MSTAWSFEAFDSIRSQSIALGLTAIGRSIGPSHCPRRRSGSRFANRTRRSRRLEARGSNGLQHRTTLVAADARDATTTNGQPGRWRRWHMRPRRRSLETEAASSFQLGVHELLSTCERVCRSATGGTACVVARDVDQDSALCAGVQAACSAIESGSLSAVCLASSGEGLMDESLVGLSERWSGSIRAVSVVGGDDGDIFSQVARHWRHAELVCVGACCQTTGRWHVH